MSDADDTDFGRRLRALDQPRPFDVDGFAERVVAERSRRRTRRIAGSGTVLFLLAATGMAWQWSREVEPKLVFSGPAVPEAAAPVVTVASSEPSIDELDALLAQLDEQRRQWDRLDRLAERITRSREALAALRQQQHQQQFALLRAEQSAHIKVPDLTRFYVDQPDATSL